MEGRRHGPPTRPPHVATERRGGGNGLARLHLQKFAAIVMPKASVLLSVG